MDRGSNANRITPAQFRLLIAAIERGAYEREITDVDLWSPTRNGVDGVVDVTRRAVLARGWMTCTAIADHAAAHSYVYRVTLDGVQVARGVSEAAVDAALARGRHRLSPIIKQNDPAPLVPGFNDRGRRIPDFIDRTIDNGAAAAGAGAGEVDGRAPVVPPRGTLAGDIAAYQAGTHDGHFRKPDGHCWASCPHDDHTATDIESWRNCSHRADYASPAEHALNCPEHGGDAGPAPAAFRRPDRFGIAEGDLIVGRDVRWGDSPVGVVAQIVPHYRHAQHAGSTYRIRCAALYPTGGPVEREVDHPSVIRRAGEPIVCGRCGNEHATPDRFVDCQVAHLRADVEGAAGRMNGEARQASA